MAKVTRITMRGDRIQWNADLVETIENSVKKRTPWWKIAADLKFPIGGKILRQRYIAFLRHEEERKNALIAKELAKNQVKLKPRPKTLGIWNKLLFWK